MKYLTVRNNSLFDDFDRFFAPTFNRELFSGNMMKTDIQDKGDHYLFEIDMAGIKKENIKLDLEDGYLTVSTECNDEQEKENKGYIRRERRYGSYSRTYYVGNVSEEDIEASYSDGTLILNVKKEQERLPKSSQIKIN